MMSVSQPLTDAAVIIRPMQAEDLPAVQAIDQVSFAMPWPASAYRYELYDNPHSLLWVAEAVGPDEQRQVVGMVVVWLIIDEAHIATIAVHPDYRARGIAAELMAAALSGALEHGMLTATLEVRAHNPPAHKLYQRFRFEVVGRRPRYYRDNNEDALIMTIDKLDRGYRDWLAGGAWKNHTENSNG
jgi:ribosomal-protein-alanine N-acetyltransferase